jgi:hypothetical protein
VKPKEDRFTGEEAYGLVAGEMYVPGEVDYQSPGEVLSELDEDVVESAMEHAKKANLPWPPVASGYYGFVFSTEVH